MYPNVPWAQPADEEYWQAIVTQGKWAPAIPSRAEDEAERRYEPVEIPEELWERLEEIFTNGETLDLPVVGYNKGGLLVEWEGVQGFVPASQLRDTNIISAPEARQAYLESRVGETLRLKIIELDRAQNRIIFSERATQWEGRCPDDIIETVQPGDIRRGIVSNVTHFGVFVDLGGIDGLIHVSELSWQRVSHPRDLLAPGDEVEVYVVEVDRPRRRIALSLKQLQPNPWLKVAERYEEGDIVEVEITNVVDFGAFARLDEGVEGLIHISELGNGDVNPRMVLHEGQRIRARIMSIDPEQQRIGLTLRETDEYEYNEEASGDGVNYSADMTEYDESPGTF